MKTVLKVVLWTLMALCLAVAGTLVCAVKLLTPDKLTPIAQQLANKYLAADVTLGRVALAFDPAFPVLRVSVDSATVVSRAFSVLTPQERAALPVYSDTLLTFDHFSGAIGLDRLMRKGEIALSDVLLKGPAVNLVIASDSLYNYNLLGAAPQDTTESALDIPPFSIDHFRLEDARAIRYYNAVDSTGATVLLLSDAGLDGTEAPAYRIKIDGNIHSPLAGTMINIENIAFGADGKVRWDPSTPALIALESFRVSGAFLTATVSTEMDFGDVMAIRSADISLDPVPLDSLLQFVPEDMRREYRLQSLSTPAAISLSACLTRPFVPAVDSIPAATVEIAVPPTTLDYGRMKLKQLALDMGIRLGGNDLDSASVEIRNFQAAGPATDIAVKGRVDGLRTDPAFSTCVKIKTRLDLLPAIVADMANGYINGTIDADVDLDGRMSMFGEENIHQLDVKGRLDARDLYYLRNDTNLMASVGKASLRFGSDVQLRRSDSVSARSLAAFLQVDTANILSGGVDIALGAVSLGIGAENTRSVARIDSTTIVPLGGMLKVGRFNVTSVSDSAGMRLRNLEGHVGISRYKNRKRQALYSLDVQAGRIAAGAPAARVMVLDPKITVEARKVHTRTAEEKHARKLRKLAQQHPELSADSVLAIAIAKRKHRPGEKVHHRVHTELADGDRQTIEWGTTNALREFLNGWRVKGRISTRKARLYTPAFPLRNRISNVDISFSTDSIVVTNLRYKGGRSDLTLNGIISNIRQGFTSAGYTSPLKANFEVVSRKIDINELAAATFAGAAYSERARHGKAIHFGLDDMDGSEDDMDRKFDILADTTGTGPLLLPTNIDGQLHVVADSIFYSDLNMRDLKGDILLYNGAVNLHDLRCTSEIGSLTLDALYSAPSPDNMKFGFGLDAKRFDIRRFLNLVPAIDSIMPLMRDFGGIISADIAATCDIDSSMNLVLPTLDAAVRLEGDSLQFIDSKTYRTIGKWLGFKDKESNIIKHLDVELTVADNILQIYPFMLDIDRYRLGVQGYNDLDMNFDYHIAVLKSPIPFKFGITVKGNPDKYKVRFGGARFKSEAPAASVAIVDTARVNLISQIQSIFRRGVSASRFARINTGTSGSARAQSSAMQEFEPELSAADSLALIREGMLESTLTQEEIEAKTRLNATGTSNAKASKSTGKSPRRKDKTPPAPEAVTNKEMKLEKQ